MEEGANGFTIVINVLLTEVRLHCLTKGYREGPGVNNFVPHDLMVAFGMAKRLVTAGFDRYLVIAPEGRIYGYFFEQLGVPLLSIFTDYSPTRYIAEDDLCVLQDQSVLLIEDDAISGLTLRLVSEHLYQFAPKSLGFYLRHTKGIQHLQNVPGEIDEIYVAEDMLSWGTRSEL